MIPVRELTCLAQIFFSTTSQTGGGGGLADSMGAAITRVPEPLPVGTAAPRGAFPSGWAPGGGGSSGQPIKPTTANMAKAMYPPLDFMFMRFISNAG